LRSNKLALYSKKPPIFSKPEPIFHKAVFEEDEIFDPFDFEGEEND